MENEENTQLKVNGEQLKVNYAFKSSVWGADPMSFQ